jgi:hypothetical protein
MDDLTIEVMVIYTVEVNDETIKRILVDRRDDGCRDGIFLEDVRDALADDRKESQGRLATYLSRGPHGLGLDGEPFTTEDRRLYEIPIDSEDFLQCLIEDMAGKQG